MGTISSRVGVEPCYKCGLDIATEDTAVEFDMKRKDFDLSEAETTSEASSPGRGATNHFLEAQNSDGQGTTAEAEDWSWCRIILECYEVRGTDVLGVGNFSVVRRGIDLKTGSMVAVKSLKYGKSGDSKFRREVFLFDAVFGTHSDPEVSDPPPHLQMHPEDDAIVKLRPKDPLWSQRLADAWRDQLLLLPRPEEMFVQLLGHSPLEAASQGLGSYMILEYGEFTLHDLVIHCKDAEKLGLRHSLSTETEMLRVLLHMSQALMFLHSRLFIHGDMKPANVMWFNSLKGGCWKLIDLDGLRTPSEVVDMRDADFYTAIYAAPELAWAVATHGPLRLSRRLDVWACGAVILELEMLTPALWAKFEELCGGQDCGLSRFMRWLAEVPEPMPLPTSPRVASIELLRTLRECMLVTDPTLRLSAVELLTQPFLQKLSTLGAIRSAPPPALFCFKQPLPQKSPTAWQLFQEEHKAELQQQGFNGSKLLKELHRRWRALQVEGGEVQPD
jgi:serine/threonine protein kinase